MERHKRFPKKNFVVYTDPLVLRTQSLLSIGFLAVLTVPDLRIFKIPAECAEKFTPKIRDELLN